jgi:hypothetical protein
LNIRTKTIRAIHVREGDGKGELMKRIINLIGCVQEAPVHHLEEELDRLTNKIVSTSSS